jgi:methionyl-tRNA synthetase
VNKQIITAALPYANGPLHIGHLAGCYLPSDIYNRYQKAKGKDVLFVCGSDEHGVPISLRAKAEGKTPQEVVDYYHHLMKETFVKMNIDFDVYSRTTNEIHHKTSQAFFKKLYDKGAFMEQKSEQLYDEAENQFLADRYVIGKCPNCDSEGAYGDQCENCGKALSPDELINPVSALSGNAPIKKETINWYLPLNEIQDKLESFIEAKEGVWRNAVYGQCLSWLKDGLKPRAMTRDLDWGVPVPIPNAEGKVMYVWFDAPIGYISASKVKLGEKADEYWKDQNTSLIHFIGKDNIVFHCLIFPAMLMMEGSYVLPEQVVANEFLNLEGNKISTSRNHAVWVHEYLNDFNNRSDELRYALCAIAPEQKDADFTWNDFQAKVNNELVAIFGNFINRVGVLTNKFYNSIVPAKGENRESEDELWKALENEVGLIEEKIKEYKFRDALFHWVNLSRIGNKYLAEQEPWKIIKTDEARTKTVMHHALNIAGLVALYSQMFLPESYEQLKKVFKFEKVALDFSNQILKEGDEILKIPLLFQPITDDEIGLQKEKLKPKFKLKEMIEYEDFTKLQIVTASIVKAEKVENADKLLKLTLQVSEGENKTVLSGIAEHYKPEDVVGKQVSYLANLAPRKMRGVVSEGMILMAEENGKLIFVSPEHKMADGSEIS